MTKSPPKIGSDGEFTNDVPVYVLRGEGTHARWLSRKHSPTSTPTAGQSDNALWILMLTFWTIIVLYNVLKDSPAEQIRDNNIAIPAASMPYSTTVSLDSPDCSLAEITALSDVLIFRTIDKLYAMTIQGNIVCKTPADNFGRDIPARSPDKQQIAYTGRHNDVSGAYIQDVDGSPVLLAQYPGDLQWSIHLKKSPSAGWGWSREYGRYVYYERNPVSGLSEEVYCCRFQAPTTMVLSLGNNKFLIENMLFYKDISEEIAFEIWTPLSPHRVLFDHTWVAAITNSSGIYRYTGNQITISNTDDFQIHRVLKFDEAIYDIAWW